MDTEKVYSVGDVNNHIARLIGSDQVLNYIKVRGEVSNVTYHTSRHIYFTIKDSSGRLSCVMFAQDRAGLTFKMEEGQQIIITGKVDVFTKNGAYQLYAYKIELADKRGALYERFEQLKRDLADSGMFDAGYKKPIPKYISTLGVVTAPTGAAIRDIINITKRRNPHIRIILYPALVQGDGAVQSIVNGIKALNDIGVDVMIVGRGGGSIEDLWAFNEEPVARAIFDSAVPVISAVGHEIDFTIADFVADLRAPTPSAGAELAVFKYDDLTAALTGLKRSLEVALTNSIGRKKDRYGKLLLRMTNSSPEHRLREQRMRMLSATDKMNELMKAALLNCTEQLEKKRDGLNEKMKTHIVNERHLFDIRIERMEALSPLKRLSSGYAFVEKDGGTPVRSISDVKKGEKVILNLKDGRVVSEVKEKIAADIEGVKR